MNCLRVRCFPLTHKNLLGNAVVGRFLVLYIVTGVLPL